MRAYYLKIGSAGIFGFAVFASTVFAQNIFDITYPVAELGGCESQSVCRAYCDEPANQDACRAFAEAKGLVKKTEQPRLDGEKKGPGGCDSEMACRAYCDDPAHSEECIDFAEREGYMTREEAERAREFLKKRGGKFEGPGECKEEKECRAYCEAEEHFDECMGFAEKEGLMTQEEIERARKFRNQTGPGGCKGEACKNYCQQAGREDECLEFAEREGLLSKEEIARAKKFMKVSSQGGPGGCRGRECEKYCNNTEHRDECFEFAKKNNLISEEELVHIERGRTLEAKVKESGGPGGCKEEKSCMEYCRSPEHVEECLGFATAHGGMNAEEAERMLKQFVEQGDAFGPRRVGETEGFGPKPGDIDARLEKFKDFEKMEREFRGRAGEFDRPRFDERGAESNMPPTFEGPGGCSSPDECMKYCVEHRDECNLSPRGAKEGFRPKGRPFESGEFKPEGRVFDTNQLRPPEGKFNMPTGDHRSPPSDEFHPSTEQPPSSFEGQYRQEYQRQYEQQYQQQFQQQYQQQHPAPQPAPTPAPSEPVSVPPTTFNRAAEAFANIIFAPVQLIEAFFP